MQLFSTSDLSSKGLVGYFYLDLYSRLSQLDYSSSSSMCFLYQLYGRILKIRFNFNRVGKYAHTCVIALQNGLLNNGSRQVTAGCITCLILVLRFSLTKFPRIQIPVALLVSQFEKKVDGHPGLLQFPEVVNLFHEFGHVVCDFPFMPSEKLEH